MRPFLVLTIALALVGAACAECDACIHGDCYRKHPLPGADAFTGAIDRRTNTLYLIDTTNSEITQCNLDAATCHKNAAKTWYLTRLTVNRHTGEVYGSEYTRSGIYKLDFVNNKMVLFVPRALATHITFQDKLYYLGSLDGERAIFTFENGVSRKVPGSEGSTEASFVVDKKSDIYVHPWTSSNDLRRLGKELGNHKKLWYSSFYVTVDRYGDALFFNKSSHAVYKENNGELFEVGAINNDNVLFPMFDRDNNFVCVFSGQYHHYKIESGVACSVTDVQNTRVITETVATSAPIIETSTNPKLIETSANEFGIVGQELNPKETKHQCTCPNACKVHTQTIFTLFANF